MQFAKYHGLGNDYIVINPADTETPLTERQIRMICHRNYGIGSDGILLGPTESAKGDFGLRIFNPDGSEAEKSGNGLRIFSRYLFDKGLVAEAPFTIDTLGGLVRSRILDQGRAVTVDMGHVSFQSAEIPMTGPDREVLNESLTVDGQTLTFSGATVGNPHCVIVREKALAEEARQWGPAIETDARFPNKTNVQFMEIMDRRNIRIEIWERGAGYTLASGSSSCAAGAVAHRLGLCEAALRVHMPGGEIHLVIAPDFSIVMSGPVISIGQGRLTQEMFSQALAE